MQANYVQRLRLTFSKNGPARYIGHLDLARTLERALNRARIPVAYSQGFNRRPRMQMAAALPLGYTSDYELADIWLMERLTPQQAGQQLMSRMAPGIEIYQVREAPLSEPALQTMTASSTYVATLLDPVDPAVLQQRIDQLLATPTMMRERGQGRKRKRYDLRPLIYELRLASATDSAGESHPDDGPLQIQMHLSLMPAATGRPDELLLALQLDPLAARVHRTRIFLAGDA